MDIATLMGIGLGILAVVGGMVAKGAKLSALANPAAAIIIFVGTFAALCNAFPMREVKRFPALFKILLNEQKLADPKTIINLMSEMAQQARREGLLSLEASLEKLDDEFLKNGLRMIVDGQSVEFVRELLEAEILAMEERHRAGALLFSQAGMYAPTLGVLGAVIGLVGALGHMDDIDALGASISAAFIATVFGIFTGYVLWHPFANKLKQKSQQEVRIKTMMMEGVLSIQVGSSPVQIREKMMIHLTQAERAQLDKVG